MHTECPENEPYYNVSVAKCSSCAEQEAIDLGTGKCIPCEYYDNTTHKCYSLPTFSNVAAIESLDYLQEAPNNTLDAIKAEIAAYQNETNRPYKECDPEAPFLLTNGTCIICDEGLFFSLKQEECVECTNYDSLTKTCPPPVPHYANLTNTNWTVDQSSFSDVYNWTNELKAVEGAVECPEGLEFYNNNTGFCQTCPEGTYFNYDRFVC